jgi:Flp pilus assembly CpaE family ATPase
LTLNIADSVVLVATQEISTVRALSMFLDLAVILEISPDKFMLVINKFQANSTLTTDKLTKRLEMPIVLTIPYDFNTVLEANNLGIPFVNENEKGAVSRAVFELAKLFMNGNDGLNSKLDELQTSLKKSLSKKKVS